MSLSHKTFAACLRVIASDTAPLYEPIIRRNLDEAASRIEQLLDIIDEYEKARLSRLGGIGSPS